MAHGKQHKDRKNLHFGLETCQRFYQYQLQQVGIRDNEKRTLAGIQSAVEDNRGDSVYTWLYTKLHNTRAPGYPSSHISIKYTYKYTYILYIYCISYAFIFFVKCNYTLWTQGRTLNTYSNHICIACRSRTKYKFLFRQNDTWSPYAFLQVSDAHTCIPHIKPTPLWQNTALTLTQLLVRWFGNIIKEV